MFASLRNDATIRSDDASTHARGVGESWLFFFPRTVIHRCDTVCDPSIDKGVRVRVRVPNSIAGLFLISSRE
jgi:hypothetical protein